MDDAGRFTEQEILTQTDAWEEACGAITRCGYLPDLDDARPAGRVLFTGCGSTYYLARSAAAHLRLLSGRPAQAAPASELWLFPRAYIGEHDILVAISRSGATSETLRAVDAFQAAVRRAPVAIHCAPDSPLARRAEVSIVISHGAERSVVQTRSFASMLIAAVALNTLWARRDDLTVALRGLPAAGTRVVEAARAVARDVGPHEVDRCYFLGSGPRYGLACEGSLKMKEMALVHAEAFHFLEFRHGPRAMLTETALVVGLVSSAAEAEEMAVLRECAALGARVLVLGERVAPVGGGPALSFASGLPEEVRDVLYLPPLQWLAYERAVAAGLDPDRPPHLSAVVTLDN